MHDCKGTCRHKRVRVYTLHIHAYMPDANVQMLSYVHTHI